MEKKTIGSFISVLRKAKGMTQRELAEQLNVSDKAVSRWEREETLPDLTLIPVLADIFGVTADELLRGCRNTTEAPAAHSEEKSQKQLCYLLNKAKTNYQIRTLIAVLIAVLGVIAAAILNLAFLRAIAGFWVGCIFFLTAAVLQTIFKIQSGASLQGEDFEGEALTACKQALNKYSFWGYTAIAALFAFTLPLLGVEDAYMGLTLESWLIPIRYVTKLSEIGSTDTHSYVACSYYPQPSLMVLLAAGSLWMYRRRKAIVLHRRLLLRTAGFTLLVQVGTWLVLALVDELLWNTGVHNIYTFSLLPIAIVLLLAEAVAAWFMYAKKAKALQQEPTA